MGKLVAHWLPHDTSKCKGNQMNCAGGSIELVPIPTKGLRELKAVSRDHAEIDSVYSNYQFINFSEAVLAAWKILRSHGVERAKQSWDDYIAAEYGGATRIFLWPVDHFEENLLETKKKFLYQSLACVDDDEAKLKLDEMSKEVKQKAGSIDKRVIDRVDARKVLALYWRLRETGLKSILTAAGEVKIPWKLEDQQKALDLLSEVATEVDYLQLVEKSKRAFDAEDLKPTTPADVLGKSEPSSTTSTASRPSSEPSLGSTSATATPSPP